MFINFLRIGITNNIHIIILSFLLPDSEIESSGLETLEAIKELTSFKTNCLEFNLYGYLK